MLLTNTLYLMHVLLAWGALSASGLGGLGFVAYVPFVLASLRHKTKKGVFFFPYAYGFLAQWLLLYWLMYINRPAGVSSFTAFMIGLITPTLLSGYLALWSVLLAITIRMLNRRGAYPVLLGVPAVTAGLEWVRGWFLTGFPWNYIGHSMGRMPVLVQAADLGGEALVSYFVMLMSVVLTFIVAAALRMEFCGARRDFGDRRVAFAATVGVLIFAGWYGYGVFRMKERVDFRVGPTVALLQGNVAQDIKNDPREMHRRILRNYKDVALAASNDGPIDLMVFPETLLPGAIVEGEANGPWGWVMNFSRLIGCEIVIGNAPQLPAQISDSETAMRFRNRATFLSSDAKVLGAYDKMHLVIFGEYIPAQKYLPRALVEAIIPPALQENSCFPGEGMQVFTASAPKTGVFPAKFGVVICYEDVVATICRDAVRMGAEMLVVVTNEGWYLDTYQMDQHLNMAVFRAVENRVPVLRAANTGISCLIDSTGRITDTVEAGGRRREVQGFLRVAPQIDPRKTIFTALGGWFGALCAVFTLGFCGYAAFVRKP